MEQTQEQKDALTEAYGRIQSGKHTYSPDQVDAINTLAQRWGVATSSAAPGEPPDPRSTWQVLGDQLKQFGGGIKDAAKGALDAVTLKNSPLRGATPPPIPGVRPPNPELAHSWSSNMTTTPGAGAKAPVSNQPGMLDTLAKETGALGEAWGVAPAGSMPPAPPRQDQEAAAREAGQQAAGLVTGATTGLASRRALTSMTGGYKPNPSEGSSLQRTGVRGLMKTVSARPWLTSDEVQHLRRSIGAVPVEDSTLKSAGNELNAYQLASGKNLLTVDDALEGIDNRISTNNEMFGRITEPSMEATNQGSAQGMMQAELLALPADLKNSNPATYDAKVAEIQSRYGNRADFKNRELNEERVSANALLRPFYTKAPGAQLTAEEQLNTAALKARRDYAAKSFYEGLSKNGVGGQAPAMVTNARMGALMELQDHMFNQVGQARLEAATPRMSLANVRASLSTGGGRLYDRLNPGTVPGINDNIASAFKKWRDTPEPVSIPPASLDINPAQPGVFQSKDPATGQLRPLPAHHTAPLPATQGGEQSDLLPADHVENELLAPPAGTANTRNTASGSTMGEDIFRVQQRADQAARRLPPPTIAGKQQSIAESATPQAPPDKPFQQPGAFYPGEASTSSTVRGLDGQVIPGAMATGEIPVGKLPNGQPLGMRRIAVDANGQPIIGNDGQPIEAQPEASNEGQGQLFGLNQTPKPPVRSLALRGQTAVQAPTKPLKAQVEVINPDQVGPGQSVIPRPSAEVGPATPPPAPAPPIQLNARLSGRKVRPMPSKTTPDQIPAQAGPATVPGMDPVQHPGTTPDAAMPSKPAGQMGPTGPTPTMPPPSRFKRMGPTGPQASNQPNPSQQPLDDPLGLLTNA